MGRRFGTLRRDACLDGRRKVEDAEHARGILRLGIDRAVQKGMREVMAKITVYPDGGTPQSTDYFIVARAGDNRKILYSNMGSIVPHTPGGRVTLVSGSPVMVGSQSNKTTIYWTPYIHDIVPIYGAAWGEYNVAELSLALDSNAAHTGYQQSGKNFDLFIVNDSGTRRLCSGVAWTSDTSRGTGAGTAECERKNGILTNKNSMVMRFGTGAGDTLTIAANQGTRVGCFRANANGQTTWDLGGLGAGGVAANLFLWTDYRPNRVLTIATVRDSADAWNMSLGVWQEKNASTGNQVNYIQGEAEDFMNARNIGLAYNSGTSIGYHGIGDGVTNARSGMNAGIILLNGYGPGNAEYSLQKLGFSYLAAVEYASGSGTVAQGIGDNTSPAYIQTGLTVSGYF